MILPKAPPTTILGCIAFIRDWNDNSVKNYRVQYRSLHACNLIGPLDNDPCVITNSNSNNESPYIHGMLIMIHFVLM